MVTTQDLPKVIGTPANHPDRRTFLYCRACGEQYSATRGDYFWKPDDEPFECDRCDIPMILARERRTIEALT